jgi:hypothetical protein
MLFEHHEFWCILLPPTLWRLLTPNYATEVLKLWFTSFLLKKKTNPTNTIFQKRNNPPTQPCAFIIPYSNMKLLKTPNNLITFEYP